MDLRCLGITWIQMNLNVSNSACTHVHTQTCTHTHNLSLSLFLSHTHTHTHALGQRSQVSEDFWKISLSQKNVRNIALGLRTNLPCDFMEVILPHCTSVSILVKSQLILLWPIFWRVKTEWYKVLYIHCMQAQPLRHVWLSVSPWTAAH